MARTAAALIIGDEILTGKIQDTNSFHLAQTLRTLAISLRHVQVVPDDPEAIRGLVSSLRGSHDFVFTSGGVGPTHDDVTIASIAQSLGRQIVRDPVLEANIRAHYGPRCTDDHLRMAAVVEGTTLHFGSDRTVRWPLMVLGNILILPGVPQLFRQSLDLVAALLRDCARPFVCESVFCNGDEPSLRPYIDRIVADFPDLSLGSYPRYFDADYTVKITFDGNDPAQIRRARDAFVHSLPPERLVRLDP
ncbi:MAG: competence/damage-inducible protein A [Deltaproteobacteria bacterium]|nr:competence/damage-inducible protein A [Deltaproteobacteria bacterium]